MSIVLKCNTVDKSNQVQWDTLIKQEVLTKEPDTLTFTVRNYGTKTWRPALGDTIELFNGATIIFGGIVTQLNEDIDGLALTLTVVCKDYSELLDRHLVAEEYDSMSADDIVDDIIANFTTATDGITATNVVAPDMIDKIKFNYITVSAALQKLCQALGSDYGWYIDYNKDIHLFQVSTNASPFNITDTNGNYNFHSLKIEQDTSQLRNHIFLRGGQEFGTTVTDQQVADGKQVVFFVGYQLSGIVVQKALAASPASFSGLTVGTDGVDNPASFDTLYNANQGLLIFPDASKPAIGDVVKYTGTPVFPLLAEQGDAASITMWGERQYLIVDKSIVSITAASDRMATELVKYSQPNRQASFTTRVDGLRAGQIMQISSVIRDIDMSFIVQRITTRFNTPTTLRYDVTAVGTDDLTLVDLLNKLLVSSAADNSTIGLDEVIQKIYTQDESITFDESVAISLTHNAQTETITFTEVDIEQPGNYATIFVLGPYVPTVALNGADTKRQFLLDGSYLS